MNLNKFSSWASPANIGLPDKFAYFYYSPPPVSSPSISWLSSLSLIYVFVSTLSKVHLEYSTSCEALLTEVYSFLYLSSLGIGYSTQKPKVTIVLSTCFPNIAETSPSHTSCISFWNDCPRCSLST